MNDEETKPDAPSESPVRIPEPVTVVRLDVRETDVVLTVRRGDLRLRELVTDPAVIAMARSAAAKLKDH